MSHSVEASFESLHSSVLRLTEEREMILSSYDHGSPIALESRAEESLISRVGRGEAAAIGELYDQHHSVLRRFARRLVGDDAAAEDLLHEVFVTVPTAIRKYRGESSLRTFLISIAVNHARHHVRASARRRALGNRLALEPEGVAVSPEHTALRRELANALHRALDQLPLDQRVAFVLCEIEEQSSPDVAAILSVPESTVRTRLFHAKRKLRELLSKEQSQ